MTTTRKNTILLAGGLVCLSGMIQLAVALGTVTLDYTDWTGGIATISPG